MTERAVVELESQVFEEMPGLLVSAVRVGFEAMNDDRLGGRRDGRVPGPNPGRVSPPIGGHQWKDIPHQSMTVRKRVSAGQ